MNKKIIIIAFCTFLFSAFWGLTIQAQDVKDTIAGLNDTAVSVPAFKNQTETNNKFDSTFFASYTGKIIGVILSFVGVLFLGLMIYGGLKWMLAAGNEQDIGKAKSLITNAIIGLIIVFAAYALTAFIGNYFLQ